MTSSLLKLVSSEHSQSLANHAPENSATTASSTQPLNTVHTKYDGVAELSG